MTREIKFRIWTIRNKKMIDIIQPSDFEWMAKIALPEPKNYLVMQFTGLKAIDKKEIYEGDIVTFRCSNCLEEHRAEIAWLNKIACWGIKNYEDKTKSSFCQPIDHNDLSKGMGLITIERVIGNIYENPALLSTQLKK